VLPWWAWVILVVLGLAWVLIFAGVSWRRGIRREFIKFLEETSPGAKVVEEHMAYLRAEGPGMEFGLAGLGALYRLVAQPEVRTAQDRREVYEKYVEILRQGVAPSTRKLDRERDAGRILPRLVTREFFAEEPTAAGAPNVPVGRTGLFVVYLLDGDPSVVYLTREHLKQIEMSEAEVGHVAIENLRAISPIDRLVRQAMEQKSVVSVKQLDTYDASRLLLLPDLLNDDETLLAAVPDRDTLVFMNQADEADVEGMTGLFPPTSEKRLLERVLRVTNRGIELRENGMQ
jgi:uncharacterized protein YtpQ (UPF0354 family)